MAAGMVATMVLLTCLAAGGLVVGDEEDGGGGGLGRLGSPDYGDALAKAILFFEGQRSGRLPANQRATWRGDSALTDGREENVYIFTALQI